MHAGGAEARKDCISWAMLWLKIKTLLGISAQRFELSWLASGKEGGRELAWTSDIFLLRKYDGKILEDRKVPGIMILFNL